MSLTELWKERLEICKQEGNGFTYDELSELWDMDRNSVSPSLATLDEQWYTKEVDGRRVVVHFDYEGMAPAKVEIHPDVNSETHRNVIELMQGTGVLPERYTVEYDPYPVVHNRQQWYPMVQRGRLRATVYEEGQKTPHVIFDMRLDNSVVINHRISFP